MQVKLDDMLKVKELMEIVMQFKDYVHAERQIFIFIEMSTRGVVSSIEFNKDCSWGMPFNDMAIPLSFIPLHIFAEFEFEVIYSLDEESQDV